MNQIFLLPLIGLLTLSSAQAADSASVFNDAESFVVARSYKLGEAGGGSDGGQRLIGAKKPAPICDGDECKTPDKCETAADCEANEYCTSLHVCKNLCERGKTYEGVVCADLPKTPSCAIETSGHVSYCACTATSCGPAWKCSMSGVRYQCEMCPAGEKCNCPDGKVSNGKGECVACNDSNACEWNQYCSAAGTTASSCEEVKCSAGQYVENHACGSCSDAMDGCKSCSSANSCDTCEIAYNLRADKSGCELKQCAEGSALNLHTGECEKCSEGATGCETGDDGYPDDTGCKDGYTLVDGKCTLDDKDADCRRLCGNDEFYYDRPGDKLNGKERVCTRYPLSCGYGCTTGWDIKYLVNDTVYTCQTAIQTESEDDKDADCRRLCGNDEFYYDRPGAKLDGKERVCTRYPLSCGYGCTKGWDIKYLVNGTVYTCQTAVQTAEDDKDADCRRLCGNSGFYYDRPGDKLDGKERVCTRYPLSCGYGCTTSWDIKYLVNGTVYTCQTAVQTEEKSKTCEDYGYYPYASDTMTKYCSKLGTGYRPDTVTVDGLQCHKCVKSSGTSGNSSSACEKKNPSSSGRYTAGQSFCYFISSEARNAWTASGGCASHLSCSTVRAAYHGNNGNCYPWVQISAEGYMGGQGEDCH